jgi:uncharacterized protein
MLEQGVLPAAGGQSFVPTTKQDRIQALDVLRGFAVFGILLVNMLLYSAPAAYAHGNVWTSVPDRIARALVVLFAEGKFYALFSFLFGLGLAVQMSRAEARGISFVPLYVRRLTVLLIIGLLHAYLLWWGDILHIYALLGFWLLIFRKRAPKTILIWAGFFLLLPALILFVTGSIGMLRAMNPSGAPRSPAVVAAQRAKREGASKEIVNVYAKGTYDEIARQRVKDLRLEYSRMGLYAPHFFALFLLGLYAGRREIFRHAEAHLPFIRRVMWGGLIVGLCGNLLFALKVELASFGQPSPLNFLGNILFFLTAPALCFFYAASITLLFQQRIWRARLSPLAAVGRMALSNYLLQTLIGTTLFYSYGLGLYGTVGPAFCLLLSVVVFLVQIPLSLWWLRRFSFGPVEWAWRSLTYLKFQPLLIRRDFELQPTKTSKL